MRTRSQCLKNNFLTHIAGFSNVWLTIWLYVASNFVSSNSNIKNMKKLLFASASLLLFGSAIAQTSSFFEKTCYRGAFAPSPAPMWTDNWTEWSPKTKVYPAPTVTISANISSNTTCNMASWVGWARSSFGALSTMARFMVCFGRQTAGSQSAAWCDYHPPRIFPDSVEHRRDRKRRSPPHQRRRRTLSARCRPAASLRRSPAACGYSPSGGVARSVRT